MALKDMVKNVTGDLQKSVDNFKGGDLLQGVANNYTPISTEQASTEFGCYLMNGERIDRAFKLIRDAMVFTDKRIIFIDRTGITGSKSIIKSINYFSIINVTLTTAGFRFDDSDMDLTYIVSPSVKQINPEYAKVHLEFPRKFPVNELYVLLQTYAYENCLRLSR
ncbi:MAG: PH domain-containing protein [Erysipelotrichaceae bacterium]|nr:PH domain-containing protein [Erysipelotrichaceae bacterium]MCI9524818.1 PH domain-containing protein [Erysipelotrichaceae bacterium]